MEKATKAYLAVLKEHLVGFCPPPNNIVVRDKVWVARLRSYWPDFSKVRVMKFDTGMKDWADNQQSDYWHNATMETWYFSDREVAIAFKLVFGGYYD